MSNVDRFRDDLTDLLKRGDMLDMRLQASFHREAFGEAVAEKFKDEKKVEKYLADLPDFSDGYQAWYSEAKALIRQLLPDRLDDFVRHYEKPKSRKEISFENYTIEDGLQGLAVTRGYDQQKIVGPDAMLARFKQQLSILKAVERRFESSLLEIRQLAQADLFDSELDAAEALLKAKHLRAAGIVSGVVLEAHLADVCRNHAVRIRKKRPTISDYNDALKNGDIIDVPRWRSIQHLGDIRNLSGHPKEREPTPDEVQSMIAGVRHVTKTLF